jgi:hypothetical protein
MALALILAKGIAIGGALVAIGVELLIVYA